MHACGHDGHMAMVLGVAKWLKNNKQLKNGSVFCCFSLQKRPAWEPVLCWRMRHFNALKVDRGLALHNLPGYKKNAVFIKEGTFASASVGLKIMFRGQSSHAAYPGEGINPALANLRICTKA